MSDDIRISVELEETGGNSLNEYIKKLHQANVTVEQLRKAYANLGVKSSTDLRRMSQVTDELSTNLAKAAREFNRLSSIRFSTYSLKDQMLEYNDATKLLGRNLDGLKEKLQNVGNYTGSLNNIIKQARNEHILLGNTIAGDVVGAYKKLADVSQNAIKGLSDKSGVYQLTDGMRQFANATSILGVKLDGLKPKLVAIKGLMDPTGVYQVSNGMRQFADATSILGAKLDGLNSKLQNTGTSISKFGQAWGAFKQGFSSVSSVLAIGHQWGVRFGAWLTDMPSKFFNAGKAALSLSSDFLGYRNALSLAADSTLSLQARLAQADVQLNKAIGIASKYKLSVVAVTKAYSKFVNALSLTGKVDLSSAEKYFESFSRFARVANLGQQNVQGMFLALEQMVSKGVVSMEELRRQLGEHLPGAVNIAAQAMQMGTQEFIKAVSSGTVDSIELIDKLSKKLDSLISDDLVETSLQKYSAAVENLNNEIKLLGKNFGDVAAKFVTPFIDLLAKLVKGLNYLLFDTEKVNESLETLADSTKDSSSALAYLRKVTDDYEGSAETVAETAKRLSEEYSGVSFSLNETAASLGIVALGTITTSKALSALLRPFSFLKNILATSGAAAATSAAQMSLFGTTVGSITAKVTSFGATLLRWGAKLNIWGALLATVSAGIYGLSNAISEMIDRSNFDPTLKAWNNELKGLGLTAGIVNDEILKLARNMKSLSGDALMGQQIALSVQQIRMAQEKLDSLRQAPNTLREHFSATGNDPSTIDSLVAAGTAGNDAKIAELEKFIAAQNIHLDGLKKTAALAYNKMPEIQAADEKLVELLQKLAIEFSGTGSKYEEVYRELAKAGKLDTEMGQQALGLAKLIDAKDKKTKKHKVVISDYDKELNKLSKTVSDYADKEREAAGTLGLSKEAVEQYNSGIEYTNLMLEISTALSGAKTTAQMQELNSYKELVQQLYSSKAARLEEARATQEQLAVEKKRNEEFKHSVELSQKQFDYNNAVIQSKRKSGELTDLQALAAYSKANKARLEQLKAQLAVAEKMGTAGADSVDKFRNEILKLQTELNLVGDLFKDSVEDSFTTFFEDIMNGTKSWGDMLKDLFLNITQDINKIVAKELAQSLTKDMFSQSGSTSGIGGIFQNLANSLIGGFMGGSSGSSGSSVGANALSVGFAGPFADGGTIPGGKMALVGEEGPELIMPKTATTVIPNNELSGTTINNYITVTTPDGNLSRQSMSQLQSAAGVGIQRAMRRNR